MLMVPINITITPQQKADLRRVSKESGLSVSEIIRRLLDNWLDSQAAQKDAEDE